VYAALEKRRILVRYFRSPLVADSLRITVGTDAEVDTFLHALQELL
jgi:histidinol-phosphate aminotransferase